MIRSSSVFTIIPFISTYRNTKPRSTGNFPPPFFIRSRRITPLIRIQRNCPKTAKSKRFRKSYIHCWVCCNSTNTTGMQQFLGEMKDYRNNFPELDWSVTQYTIKHFRTGAETILTEFRCTLLKCFSIDSKFVEENDVRNTACIAFAYFAFIKIIRSYKYFRSCNKITH